MRNVFLLVMLIFTLENAVLFFPKIQAVIFKKEKSQIVRGWEKAEALGCFSCHGPRGFGATPNPKSEDGEVPSFREREPMMHAKNDKELREIILYGHKKEEEKHDKHHAHEEDEGLIKMPAWEKLLSSQDLDDIVVFIKANAVMLNPKDKKLKGGRDLVLENACFACHGPMGAGGINNPGSFKGYIPSLIGNDYDELVKSKEELVEWIKEGKIKRFENHFIARIFMKRQIIKMPEYHEVLSNEEINSIMDYLNWLRKEMKPYSR